LNLSLSPAFVGKHLPEVLAGNHLPIPQPTVTAAVIQTNLRKMKFSAGQWKMEEGIVPFWAAHAFKTTITEPDAEAGKSAAVRLLLCKPVHTRGDTLDTSTITTTLSSPAPGVISVHAVHWKGSVRNGPNFAIDTSAPSDASVRKEGSRVILQSGSLSASIETADNQFTIDFLDPKGSRLTGHGFRSLGYMKDVRDYPYTEGIYRGHKGFICANLDIGVGELVYGLGERFGPLVKNGQIVDCWNEDGGTSSELSYKNVPFYMTNKGYGVLVRHTGRVAFEVMSERSTRCNISVQDEQIEYLIIHGPTPKEILSKYVALTGRAPLPPAWSYGLWLTSSFTTNYDEQTVTGFVDKFAELDIPLSVFHFDCFWMRGFEWTNFEWDEEQFSDPEGYLTRLIKEKNLQVCVWINPYIAQESKLFDEAVKHGYLMMKTDGNVLQLDMWQSGMGIVDFTNPGACKWYQGYLAKLIAQGVTAFKTDFGERIPFTNVSYHDKSDPYLMHNYYTHLYNRCVQDILDEKLGPGASCLFARSATAGGQTMPVVWGGDCESTYVAMGETLRGGMSLGMSGFAHWSHDISGFEGAGGSLPPAHLYKRWVAFGLLSSHSRLHGSKSYRVPWIYDDEACDVLRRFTKLKISLAPYLFAAAVEARQQGTPVLRATCVEFPKDKNVWHLDQQYMFGPSLLVAPIFNEQGTVEFYVPQAEDGSDDEWTSLFTGKRYKPGKWYNETHDFLSLPLLLRPNSLLIRNTAITRPEHDISEGLEALYGHVTKDVSVEVFDSRGNVLGSLATTQEGGKVSVLGDGIKVKQSFVGDGKGIF